jgi:hypothetical protein
MAKNFVDGPQGTNSRVASAMQSSELTGDDGVQPLFLSALHTTPRTWQRDVCEGGSFMQHILLIQSRQIINKNNHEHNWSSVAVDPTATPPALLTD